MPEEYREPSEMERDVVGFSQSYLDDIGVDLDTSVVWESGEEIIVTHAVKTLGGEWEYLRPAARHGTVDAWREWVESDYAPSFYP